MGVLSKHIPKAIADGVITPEEVMLLAKDLFEVFGVLNFKIPDMPLEIALHTISVKLPKSK